MPVHLAVAARSDVGRVRRVNEDAFLVADVSAGAVEIGEGVTRLEAGDRGVLLAVSDGMGGHQAGEVASALTLESLLRELGERTSMVEPHARVQRAVEGANRKVFEAARTPGHENMGATLTAVLIDGAEAHLAEIGDSRAYLLRGGDIRQVTHDQSYVQILLDSGVLAPEEAAQSPMRNVILQAVGQKPSVTVALGKLALRQRDCLLLCSDGLSGKVTPEELRDAVLGAPTLDIAAERLVSLANERGGDDNITVLLAGVSGDVPAYREGERISETLQILTSFDPPTKGF